MAQISIDHIDAQRRAARGGRGRSGQSDGDFRGRYGYGRPAHKPDPNASYGFETYPLPRQ